MVMTILDQGGHDELTFGHRAILYTRLVLDESDAFVGNVVVSNSVKLGPTAGQLEAVPGHISVEPYPLERG
jgi:hypothetical protein